MLIQQGVINMAETLLVSMGEIGVMHPGNAGVVTELKTWGASPCVIVGVQKGSTSLLAHVHRANKISKAIEQMSDILNDAFPGTDTGRAFISTQVTNDVKEVARQIEIITDFRQWLISRDIRLIELNEGCSAAIVNKDGYRLFSDVAIPVTQLEFQNFFKWAMGYEVNFQGATNAFPMVIRVGNLEAPSAFAVINRLFVAANPPQSS
jgi:hypothetical protein